MDSKFSKQAKPRDPHSQSPKQTANAAAELTMDNLQCLELAELVIRYQATRVLSGETLADFGVVYSH